MIRFSRRALPAPHELSPAITLEYLKSGGHVGFVGGRFPGKLDWLPQRVLGFFGAPDATTR